MGAASKKSAASMIRPSNKLVSSGQEHKRRERVEYSGTGKELKEVLRTESTQAKMSNQPPSKAGSEGINQPQFQVMSNQLIGGSNVLDKLDPPPTRKEVGEVNVDITNQDERPHLQSSYGREEHFGEIKSKRGSERLQKILQEKNALKQQVDELEETVRCMQVAITKDQVGDVLTVPSGELLIRAKQEIIRYLNTREKEVDYSVKAQYFYKYLSDPFYMQIFVHASQPQQWRELVESIYETIEPQKLGLGQSKDLQNQDRPIQSRTSALGAPLIHAGSPVDRIALHLGNMGI